MKHLVDSFKSGKLTLYSQSWLPEKEPKAILLVVHGLAEHCGRYMSLVNRLVPRGYGVCSFDLRGHGKSEGTRGHVERFRDYASDLGLFHQKLKQEHRNTKIFLLGHSMGTLIALSYALGNQSAFKGLILSGTMVRQTNPHSALAILGSRVLSVAFPRAGVMRLDAETIARDKSVVHSYENDPFVYRGHISARLGVELLGAMRRLSLEVSQIKLPVILLHGEADLIADPKGSELIYQNIGSSDKTLKIYPGCYHEVFNDFGYEKVIDDLYEWLEQHL